MLRALVVAMARETATRSSSLQVHVGCVGPRAALRRTTCSDDDNAAATIRSL
jgi:hypothetical protein